MSGLFFYEPEHCHGLISIDTARAYWEQLPNWTGKDQCSDKRIIETVQDYLRACHGLKNVNALTAERARAELKGVPSDDRIFWLKIGTILKVELGDNGWDVFDEWSSTSAKYDQQKNRRQWDAIRTDHPNPIRWGTARRLISMMSETSAPF